MALKKGSLAQQTADCYRRQARLPVGPGACSPPTMESFSYSGPYRWMADSNSASDTRAQHKRPLGRWRCARVWTPFAALTGMMSSGFGIVIRNTCAGPSPSHSGGVSMVPKLPCGIGVQELVTPTMGGA